MTRTFAALIRRTATRAALLALAMASAARAATDEGFPAIPPPVIPDHTFNITEFGAVGDGTTLNTEAIKKALAACEKAGGGTVVFPPGKFLTGPLTLISNLNLKIEKGSTLLLSDDPKTYKVTNNSFENSISADNCHDLAITGGGTIDGQGAFFWKNFVTPKDAAPGTPPLTHRPYMVKLAFITRLLVEDVTLQNSPSFHLVPHACQDVTIRNVRIHAPPEAKNTDAMDPSGWNFLITGCTFDVGDDNIAIKPVAQIDPAKPSCMNFLVTDCTFLHGHGMSIGGQSSGGLKHLVVRNCTFDGTEAGIRMKAGRGTGGLVEDCVYEDLKMRRVKVPIFLTSFYPKIPDAPSTDPAQPVTDKTPIWRNIRITNVTAEDCPTAGRILGLAEMPIRDVTLTNVKIAAKKGLEITRAEGIKFVDSQLTIASGPAMTVKDAKVEGIDPATGK